MLAQRRGGVTRAPDKPQLEFTMFKAPLILACLFAGALAPQAGAQNLDNLGSDFFCSFLPNPLSSGHTMELHLTAPVATSVTVEYPVNAPTFTTTVNLVPGTITIVSLPTSVSLAWVDDTVANNVVHAFAPNDFVCYMINRALQTSDAGLALPIDTMNTDYIAIDYNPTFGPSQFTVFAGFDNTTVTITPSVALNGHAAGVPFNVLLNRGEGYYGTSLVTSGAAGSITGTLISATRPVGLTNGSLCVQIPTGTVACDHIFEVAQPVATWGMDVLVANLPDRPSGTIYRVTASENATQVALDGANLALLNAGQYFETPPTVGNHMFSANRPIYVTQYMTGNGSGGATTGDPAMGNSIPCAQFLSNYTFSTVGGGQFAQEFLTVFAQNADVGTITLDGVPIGAGNFTAVGASGFSVAIRPLASGTHVTSSNGVHGITVEGYNGFDSYLFPGGALFAFINPAGDANPPICSIVNNPNAISANGTATDNRPSEDVNNNNVLDPGEDLNSNGQIDTDTGIFFITLEPGAANMTLNVPPFVPGTGVVNFTLNLINTSLPGSATVRITDGAGNFTTCPVNLIGAECHLFIGSGQGAANITINGHQFASQLNAIRATFPVVMDSFPSFPLPAPGANPLRGQVVMWNPTVFPTNPSQWSRVIQVRVDASGTPIVSASGNRNNITMRADIYTTPGGETRVRFPFFIEGM